MKKLFFDSQYDKLFLKLGGDDTRIVYHVVDLNREKAVPAKILPATDMDFQLTDRDHWQTSWLSEYIQDPNLKKFALKVAETDELVGLGAYRDMPEGILVYVEYIESAPHSNPTLTRDRKYRGIGAALLAYGVQMSVDYGYGGAIYLKAKTSEIREHYVRDFGAIPFSRMEPFLLLIDGEAAQNLLSQFMEVE